MPFVVKKSKGLGKSIIAGEAIDIGDVVCIKDAKIYKADNTDVTKKEVIGIANSRAAANGRVEIVTEGVVGGLSGLTVGQKLYLGNAGAVSASGSVQLGVAITATEFELMIGLQDSDPNTIIVRAGESVQAAVDLAVAKGATANNRVFVELYNGIHEILTNNGVLTIPAGVTLWGRDSTSVKIDGNVVIESNGGISGITVLGTVTGAGASAQFSVVRVGASSQANFLTLDDAVNSIPNGSGVLLEPGEYTLNVNKRLGFIQGLAAVPSVIVDETGVVSVDGNDTGYVKITNNTTLLFCRSISNVWLVQSMTSLVLFTNHITDSILQLEKKQEILDFIGESDSVRVKISNSSIIPTSNAKSAFLCLEGDGANILEITNSIIDVPIYAGLARISGCIFGTKYSKIGMTLGGGGFNSRKHSCVIVNSTFHGDMNLYIGSTSPLNHNTLKLWNNTLYQDTSNVNLYYNMVSTVTFNLITDYHNINIWDTATRRVFISPNSVYKKVTYKTIAEVIDTNKTVTFANNKYTMTGLSQTPVWGAGSLMGITPIEIIENPDAGAWGIEKTTGTTAEWHAGANLNTGATYTVTYFALTGDPDEVLDGAPVPVIRLTGTLPTGNPPTGQVYLYLEGGKLKIKLPNGSVETITSAVV